MLPSEIIHGLSALAQGSLDLAARTFFAALGYRSERTLPIHTLAELKQHLDPNDSLTEQNACLSRWRSVDFLFQITGSELAGDDRQGLQIGRASCRERV